MDSNGRDEGRTLVSLDANVNQESAPTNSEVLCELCNSLDFDYVFSLAENPDRMDRPLDTRESNVSEVLQKSQACFFCKMIGDFAVEKFNIQYTPGFERDVPTIEVTYSIRDFFEENMRRDGGDDQLRTFDIHRVRLKVFLGVSIGYGYEGLQFQRCSQQPSKVEDFCNGGPPSNWGIRPEQAYSGRIRPLLADTRLFRKWKETCCAVHGERCNSILTHGRRLPRLRLIDVVKRCVVDREEKGDIVGDEDGFSYTALSYVWGKDKISRLTKSTEAQFRQAGSLKREVMPSTIDDAFEVTKSLGEKYIWVDSLCILQDDEADKQEFISQMDSIYRFASVTIVAASGDNANAGLPGIRPNSRTHVQIPFMIKGVSLLQTLDPVTSRGDFSSDSYLGKSMWYMRGWTFQERIFSRRVLIFTKEQVYWECQTATWCEDSVWETVESPIVYHHCFNERDFRHPWPSDVGSFERLYRKLVQRYSQRMLTHESDGLDAFKGFLNAFETNNDQRFLWALPTSFLSNALTWSGMKIWSGLGEETMHRRQVNCSVSLYEEGSCAATITSCPFPSWSWVGWVGEIGLASSHAILDTDTVDLIFFYLDSSGSLRQVESTVATQSLSKAIASKTNGRTTRQRIRDKGDETIVTLERIRPERARRLSIASNILFFWSSTAVLLVKQNSERRPASEGNYSLFQNGKLVKCHGNSFHNIWNVEPGHAELIELVVIGRFVSWGVMRPGKNELAVLLLSWDVDGIAYRREMVFIKRSHWLQLEREWKLINLG